MRSLSLNVILSLANWIDATVSKKFGDTLCAGLANRWLKEKRSCILFVPSIVAPLDNNILINEFHPQFPNLTTSLNKPIICDRRLFIDT